MDRSLDDIVADNKHSRGGNRDRNRDRDRDGGSRRRERPDYPRDGVRKSYREDAPRNLDSEWVHDRFDENGAGKSRQPRGGRGKDREDDIITERASGTKVRVDNVHYELSREDLQELFNRIGPVAKLDIRYDRAGRSTGTAFVTYEHYEDARTAVDEFDGANAAGQPIRLAIIPSGPAPRSRNPFDTAVMPSRSLEERISRPNDRSRSESPGALARDARRKGIDRYIPGERETRSRSPLRSAPRREAGRRPGERRGGRGGGIGDRSDREGGGGGAGAGAGGGAGGERRGRDGRPRKTQEELDAEMAEYFGDNGGGGGSGAAAINRGAAATTTTTTTTQSAADDVDMIE